MFDDIRATRKSDFVNNIWRALAAVDPRRATAHVGRGEEPDGRLPGALDQKTREMIYIAVSAANSCEYCVHSHTKAAARAQGMTAAEHSELLQIIALAASTNHLANAMQVRGGWRPVWPISDPGLAPSTHHEGLRCSTVPTSQLLLGAFHLAPAHKKTGRWSSKPIAPGLAPRPHV